MGKHCLLLTLGGISYKALENINRVRFIPYSRTVTNTNCSSLHDTDAGRFLKRAFIQTHSWRIDSFTLRELQRETHSRKVHIKLIKKYQITMLRLARHFNHAKNQLKRCSGHSSLRIIRQNISTQCKYTQSTKQERLSSTCKWRYNH